MTDDVFPTLISVTLYLTVLDLKMRCVVTKERLVAMITVHVLVQRVQRDNVEVEQEEQKEEEGSVCWWKSGVMEYRIAQTGQTSYHVTSLEKTLTFAATGKYLSVRVSVYMSV